MRTVYPLSGKVVAHECSLLRQFSAQARCRFASLGA
jgi:hypothetical protein